MSELKAMCLVPSFHWMGDSHRKTVVKFTASCRDALERAGVAACADFLRGSKLQREAASYHPPAQNRGMDRGLLSFAFVIAFGPEAACGAVRERWSTAASALGGRVES